MIQANELRIGNLFQDKLTKSILWVSELHQEYGSFDYKIFYYVLDRSKYPLPKGWQAEPVTLTPEIIEKCGFVNGILHPLFFLGNGDLTITGSEYDYNGLYFGKIQHLHQLQNLYFALTGTELEITL